MRVSILCHCRERGVGWMRVGILCHCREMGVGWMRASILCHCRERGVGWMRVSLHPPLVCPHYRLLTAERQGQQC